MQKSLIASLLVIMTAISGVTYHFMSNSPTVKSLSSAPEDDTKKAWGEWQQTYGKIYKDQEVPLRYSVFSENYNFINTHNAIKTNKYVLGLNQFADFTNAEFSILQQGQFNDAKLGTPVTLEATEVASIDWRTKGAVTDVKNQGQCGSCWAFSTAGALEGLNANNGGTLESFSPQQLVDCAGSFGPKGCDGGNFVAGFEYTAKYGIEGFTTYPYEAKQGTCNYDKSQVLFTNNGNTVVDQNQPDQLKAAVALGPVSVGIEADKQVFQFYKSGTFDNADCGTQMDHAVLVVGYGTDANNVFYWIVKNSWGSTWGLDGYIHIALGQGAGICGINQMPAYPTM